MIATGLIIVLLVAACVFATKRILTLLLSSEENVSEQSAGKVSSKKRSKCEQCAVGKKSYEIDKHSEACPYLESMRAGKCSFFEPIQGETDCNCQCKN